MLLLDWPASLGHIIDTILSLPVRLEPPLTIKFSHADQQKSACSAIPLGPIPHGFIANAGPICLTIFQVLKVFSGYLHDTKS